MATSSKEMKKSLGPEEYLQDMYAAAAAEVTRRLDPNNDPNEGGREHGHDEENLGD